MFDLVTQLLRFLRQLDCLLVGLVLKTLGFRFEPLGLLIQSLRFTGDPLAVGVVESFIALLGRLPQFIEFLGRRSAAGLHHRPILSQPTFIDTERLMRRGIGLNRAQDLRGAVVQLPRLPRVGSLSGFGSFRLCSLLSLLVGFRFVGGPLSSELLSRPALQNRLGLLQRPVSRVALEAARDEGA